MGVSKTDFMRGMQCPKMLWLDRHKPSEKIIPPEVQALLDKGNEFGDAAMGMFGDYTETTTYKEDGRLDYSAMIEKTKECLCERVSVICEASFSYYGNFCAVDILRRRGNLYDVYEVKNSDSVKEQFIKDIGFQIYILRRCGVRIGTCNIVYHSLDEENPFAVCEVTGLAKEYSQTVNDNIWRLGKIKYQKEEYEQGIGIQCELPYRCWYYDYCHKERLSGKERE